MVKETIGSKPATNFEDRVDHSYSDDFCRAVLLTREEIVDPTSISAVFILIFDPFGNILVFDNVRGIDIPGGHTNPDEQLLEALNRELREEVVFSVDSGEVLPLAVVHRTASEEYSQQNMWFGCCYLSTVPELTAARFIDTFDFLQQYTQTEFKGVLSWLLQEAKKNVRP